MTEHRPPVRADRTRKRQVLILDRFSFPARSKRFPGSVSVF